MQDKFKTRVKVGITVIIAVLILFFGISFLKEIQYGVKTNDITIYFKEVNGLKEGDQVGVNGVKKGKVENITLDGDSVKVVFSLSTDVVLKKDYNINVAMIELMSGKQLDVSPGKSKEPIDISKPLTGSKSQDIVSLIETMSGVGDMVKEIVYKLDTTSTNLNKTILSVNAIVGDETLRLNIQGSASNFNAASQNLNYLIKENRANLNDLTARLKSMANNLDNTFAESSPDIRQSVSNIKSLTARMDSLTSNFNRLIVNANDSTGTIGKLITNDELYNSFNKNMESLNKLIKDMNKMIKRDGIKISIF